MLQQKTLLGSHLKTIQPHFKEKSSWSQDQKMSLFCCSSRDLRQFWALYTYYTECKVYSNTWHLRERHSWRFQIKEKRTKAQCEVDRKKQPETDRETEMAKDSGHCSKPDYDWMWIRFPNRWSRSETVRCISQQWGEEEGEDRGHGWEREGRTGQEARKTSVNSSLWQVKMGIYSEKNLVSHFYSVNLESGISSLSLSLFFCSINEVKW